MNSISAEKECLLLIYPRIDGEDCIWLPSSAATNSNGTLIRVIIRCIFKKKETISSSRSAVFQVVVLFHKKKYLFLEAASSVYQVIVSFFVIYM